MSAKQNEALHRLAALGKRDSSSIGPIPPDLHARSGRPAAPVSTQTTYRTTSASSWPVRPLTSTTQPLQPRIPNGISPDLARSLRLRTRRCVLASHSPITPSRRVFIPLDAQRRGAAYRDLVSRPDSASSFRLTLFAGGLRYMVSSRRRRSRVDTDLALLGALFRLTRR